MKLAKQIDPLNPFKALQADIKSKYIESLANWMENQVHQDEALHPEEMMSVFIQWTGEMAALGAMPKDDFLGLMNIAYDMGLIVAQRLGVHKS
jgi:hypothetical protein